MPIRRDSVMFVMPALLRFLLCTGLRIGEALGLLDTDVNLQNKMLIIRDSKNGKERLVPFSDSLATILTQYRIHRVRLNPSPSTSHFFLSARGRSLEPGDIYVCFKRILHKAGIPFKGNHYGPRVHDFRHTFAVRSLVHMLENGIVLPKKCIQILYILLIQYIQMFFLPLMTIKQNNK